MEGEAGRPGNACSDAVGLTLAVQTGFLLLFQGEGMLYEESAVWP